MGGPHCLVGRVGVWGGGTGCLSLCLFACCFHHPSVQPYISLSVLPSIHSAIISKATHPPPCLSVQSLSHASSCLSIRPSPHPSIEPACCGSIYQSVCLSSHLSINPTTAPSAGLSIHLSVCPSIQTAFKPSASLFVCPSVHLSSHWSLYHCQSIHQITRLSIHPNSY